MSEIKLEGRLGVETISPLRGCCVDSILTWRPNMLGQKNKCLFCDNPMKAIRAGEFSPTEWTGMLNETKKSADEMAHEVESVWFSKKKFSSEGAVTLWCKERGLVSKSGVIEGDDMAYRIILGKAVPGTERALWAAPGVIAVFGLTEKMDTGDMATGGMLSPQQGKEDGAEEDSLEEETTTTEKKDEEEEDDDFFNEVYEEEESDSEEPESDEEEATDESTDEQTDSDEGGDLQVDETIDDTDDSTDVETTEKALKAFDEQLNKIV